MAFIPLRSEKSISDVSEKLFKGLTPAKRKQAEAALLKENPKLREFSKLKPGTLLRIPNIKGLARKKTRSIADPEEDLIDEFIERLALFNKNIVAENAKKDKEQKTMQEILKKAAINRLVVADKQSKRITDSLKQHLSADIKERKEIEKESKKVLETLSRDLGKMLK